MRKLLAATLVGLIVTAPMASARVGGQKESGMILLPVPDPQASGESCFQGVERRFNMVTQDVATGIFGYAFDVDKKTWNKKFKVGPTGGGGDIDLDIYFFLSFGPGIPDDPSMNGPSIIGEYNEAKVGGESGIVPKASTRAIVCMKGGVGATFEYASK